MGEGNTRSGRPAFLTYVRGNNLIDCVANPQVKEIKAVNIFESYGCLTVNREQEF